MEVKVEQQTKGLLVFHLYEEKTRARIRYYINLEEYELVVTGETTASYKWVSGTKESFIDLLLRSDEGYILMKLGYSKAKIFNLDKSIEETINNIKDNYGEDITSLLESEDVENFYDELKQIDDCWSPEGFVIKVNEVIDSYSELEYLDIHECIESIEEHPHWLVRSVELFCSDIKPLLVVPDVGKQLHPEKKGEN